MKKSLGERILAPINWVMPGRPRISDMTYGNESDMDYDEYPSKDPNAPLVIFWYGGSWKTGDKSMYRFMGHKLQSMGAHAFVVNYIKYPKRVFPGFTDDASLAVETIKRRYPGRSVILMGHSAGANTALSLGMKKSLNINKVISVSGVCSLNMRYWGKVFQKAIKSHAYDPRTLIENSSPETEFLLVHGKLDYIVSPSDSISLNSQLNLANRRSQLVLLNIAEHVLILPVIFTGLRFFSLRKIKKFILA